MGLKIFLLGQFNLRAEGEQIVLPSRPAQSLLAYLALNAGVTHRREKLAGMLWPEATEGNARSYLRQALWRVRKSVETVSLKWEDYFQISDISVAFDSQSEYFLDVASFLAAGRSNSVEELIEIVNLYKGELLPGFYDEWILLERDRLQAAYHQKMNLLLEKLFENGRWGDVLTWSEQWILLGHSPEPAFRALMGAYAGLGDQSMVSFSYQRCVEALDRDLGVEPSAETKQLYERYRHGQVPRTIPTTHKFTNDEGRLPSILSSPEQPPSERSLFVARKRELSRLGKKLTLALRGDGQVAFVTGEAGSGKSTLIHEFTRRALENYPELLIAGGNCNAYTGIGDPYLPFREILELLTGDVEARFAAGAISREHARLLWDTLPISGQILVENCPDLIGTFLSSSALQNRVRTYSPSQVEWPKKLDELAKHTSSGQNAPNPNQSDLFEQYTHLIRALGQRAPLVLVLDDLQWADLGSISLLFHIGRHLTGSRILIVGAYRPEEIALGRPDYRSRHGVREEDNLGDKDRHPLEPVINELQRIFGDIIVNVDQAERRNFMDALLDSEPNQLGSAFRDKLFRQTGGHPLFTIELLRGMQERGDLVQDSDGLWIEGAALDWETLPARVEAAIAERIGRLAPPLREILRIASVEGEDFTAEIAARVLEYDEKYVVQRLSRDLDRKHRLVRAKIIERIAAQRVSRYRFSNYLFQKYLYDNLDEAERSYLHEDVGNALEMLYDTEYSDPAVIAPQLAWHFQEAGATEKAIPYLLQAGERAAQLCAYQEAIAHLGAGVALLEITPEYPARVRHELSLQLALGTAWQGVEGARAPEVKRAYTRAYELCQQSGEITQLSQVLGERLEFCYVGSEFQTAIELATEALDLAQQAHDPLLEAFGHWYLGFLHFGQGNFDQSREYHERVISFYEPELHHHPFIVLRGKDAGVGAMAYLSSCLWCLGYPDRALELSNEALNLARELGQLFSLADVLSLGGCQFHSMRRDAESLKDCAEELMELTANRVPGWRGTGEIYLGQALVLMEQTQKGIEWLQKGLKIRRSLDTQCYGYGALRALAEFEGSEGRPEKGLSILSDALAQVQRTGEAYNEAELNRVKGELHRQMGDDDQAEESFTIGIAVARRQNAKSWELRTANSLARLMQTQGRIEEATQILEPVYLWFSEGFETPDLREAKSLLGI